MLGMKNIKFGDNALAAMKENERAKLKKKIVDKFGESQYKRAEVLSMADYYWKKSKAGRVIPLNTMTVLVLLKR